MSMGPSVSAYICFYNYSFIYDILAINQTVQNAESCFRLPVSDFAIHEKTR